VPTRREAVLLYAVVLVASFAGTWVLDRLPGTPSDPARTAIFGLCLAAGWRGGRRIVQLAAVRRH
jgi:hypothetical protein